MASTQAKLNDRKKDRDLQTPFNHQPHKRLARSILADTARLVLVSALPGTGRSSLLTQIEVLSGVPLVTSPQELAANSPLCLIDLPMNVQFVLPQDGGRIIISAAPHQIAGFARLQLYGDVRIVGNADLFLSDDDPAFDQSGGWPALSAFFNRETPKDASPSVPITYVRDTVLPALTGGAVAVLHALALSQRGLDAAPLDADARAELHWLQPLVLQNGHRWTFRTSLLGQIFRDAMAGNPVEHRTSSLLEAAGEPGVAIRSALAAGHRRRALAILERGGGVMLGHLEGPGEARAVLDAFGQDPDPTVMALRVMIALKSGQASHAALLLDAAEQMILNTTAEPDRASLLTRQNIPPELRMVRLLMGVYSDKPVNTNFYAEFAALLAEAPPENHLLRGSVYNVALDEQIRRGRVGEALATGDRALAHYDAAGAPYLSFYIHVHLALMHLMAGAPNDAEPRLDLARQKLTETSFDTPQDDLFLTLLDAQVAYEQGRPEAMARFAETAFERFAYGELWPTIAAQALAFGAEALLQLRGAEAALHYIDSWRVQMWRTRRFRLLVSQREILVLQSANRWREARNQLEAMATRIGHIWIESAGENLTDLRDAEDLTQALIWLRQKVLERPRDTGLGDQLAMLAANPHLSWRQRQCLAIWQAWSARRRGKIGEARRLLAQVLDTTAARSCRAPVMEERQLVVDMLDDPRMAGGPMEGRPVPRDLRRGALDIAITGLLSRQELRALLLLSEGCSNKELAREMRVSLPTVKFHLRNLYAKLGAADRRQAIDIARSRKILTT
ncbi:LuxR C-terminal-related transcriptional regulator [Yoonia sp.]|uniref:helix-turn-helix transcriptional regulator n=1 Tax=Yoonia sp. TaxID=2212373 RepID=UPI0039754262